MTTTPLAPARLPLEGESLVDYLKAHGKHPATLDFIGQLYQFVCQGWDDMNDRNIERNTKIAALEAKVAQLEARPVGLKYLGTWQPAGEYHQDDGVTHDGSVWICRLNHVRSQPGVDHTSWTLAVKKGRDAKGAR